MNDIICGDNRDVLPLIPDNSIDSIVTDPPYHLTQKSRKGSPRNNNPNTPHGRHRLGDKGFMGQVWDGGDIAFSVPMWKECLRVLKPGGHLLAFGGTRTFHRMACAVEDAGFEIRDTVCWITGQGFPKSLNIGDGLGTALKPSVELLILARKPLEGTVAENVKQYGTGALNIDDCRIGTASVIESVHMIRKKNYPQTRTDTEEGWGRSRGGKAGDKVDWEPKDGRWPANVILTHHEECRLVGTKQVKNKSGSVSGKEPSHTGDDNTVCYGEYDRVPYQKYGDADGMETVEVWECHPDCPIRMLDQQSGIRPSCTSPSEAVCKSKFRPNQGKSMPQGRIHHDVGGASRFFYCTKASTRERNLGLDDFPKVKSSDEGYGSIQQPKLDRAAPRENWTPHKSQNHHPTVKPVGLLRYLVHLITPSGGVVLDPFCGSGSTGVACALDGFGFFGIEREDAYVSIAQARIAYADTEDGRKEWAKVLKKR